MAKYKNQNGQWSFSLSLLCTLHFAFTVFLLPFVSTLCATSAAAQDLQQVIEGAKKEGQVRVYSSMQKETSRPVLDAFRKKYPFITKIDHHRFTGLEESERVIAELRVGRVDMDVLLVRSELWDRHKPFLAPPVDWKPLGVPEDRIKKSGMARPGGKGAEKLGRLRRSPVERKNHRLRSADFHDASDAGLGRGKGHPVCEKNGS